MHGNMASLSGWRRTIKGCTHLWMILHSPDWIPPMRQTLHRRLRIGRGGPRCNLQLVGYTCCISYTWTAVCIMSPTSTTSLRAAMSLVAPAPARLARMNSDHDGLQSGSTVRLLYTTTSNSSISPASFHASELNRPVLGLGRMGTTWPCVILGVLMIFHRQLSF